MKRMLLVLLVIVFSFGIMAGKPPDPPKKPPGIARVEIVNRSGEQITVSMSGMGWDFRTESYVQSWGLISPSSAYIVVPGTKTITLRNGGTYIVRLPEVIKHVDVFKDLYIITVSYAREADGTTICLNNWTPAKLWYDPAFFAVTGSHSKLIVKGCNQIPANLGKNDDGVLKFNRLGILLATSGYLWSQGYQYK